MMHLMATAWSHAMLTQFQNPARVVLHYYRCGAGGTQRCAWATWRYRSLADELAYWAR